MPLSGVLQTFSLPQSYRLTTRTMADQGGQEIDLDSVIDRLLEGQSHFSFFSPLLAFPWLLSVVLLVYTLLTLIDVISIFTLLRFTCHAICLSSAYSSLSRTMLSDDLNQCGETGLANRFNYRNMKLSSYALALERSLSINPSYWNSKPPSRSAVSDGSWHTICTSRDLARVWLSLLLIELLQACSDLDETGRSIVKILELSLHTCSYPRSPRNMRRWHPRPVLWFTTTIWIRWISSGGKLLVPRRLRRSWQTITGDHMPLACLQNQISRKLLYSTRQSRMCEYQPDIWLLRWM